MMDKTRNTYQAISGLAFLSIGLVALLAAFFAFIYLGYSFEGNFSKEQVFCNTEAIPMEYLLSLGGAAAVALAFIVFLFFYFNRKKAQKQGLPLWDAGARRALYHFLFPLVCGACLCGILLYFGLCGLMAPVSLIFYGIGLWAAGAFSLPEIRSLGIAEVVLGFISCIFVRESLFFWAIGLGLFHILAGGLMYAHYERT